MGFISPYTGAGIPPCNTRQGTLSRTTLHSRFMFLRYITFTHAANNEMLRQ